MRSKTEGESARTRLRFIPTESVILSEAASAAESKEPEGLWPLHAAYTFQPQIQTVEGTAMSERSHTLTAILPCNDIAKSRAFYERLDFEVTADYDGQYVILADGKGAELHLQPAELAWLKHGQNPFGLYLYAENVDELAARFAGEILGKVKQAEDKPWGMYEFALSDPDETLVRIGWPTRLLREPQA